MGEPTEGVNEGVNDGVNEDNLFVKPKKLSMFSHESGIESKMNEEMSDIFPIFVTKNMLQERILEVLNQDATEAPAVQPTTKPQTKPVETPKPSRRNKPFMPSIHPSVNPGPKALKETKKDGKYTIYHDSFTSACNEALRLVKERGLEVDENDWFNRVATGPGKPKVGQTNRFSVDLTKDNKPVKEQLNFQVYALPNKYELNCYIQ